MRVHFATFDAADGLEYNLANCRMAARALNANVAALAEKLAYERQSDLGYWCEAGAFDQRGDVPATFDTEWPTEAE
ncbi:hypothetical protein A6F65_02163 [Paraurantiacibacter namhicola]|uniref:Uncharacterized protein n=1 Tax=Paraurantiacibacter namhicola TaxID=645517 RepID=A0A1C7DAC2_9SPHN|nr:hypothetical protein A6F65_02163 [Paraurantiacibacter namhicola]